MHNDSDKATRTSPNAQIDAQRLECRAKSEAKALKPLVRLEDIKVTKMGMKTYTWELQ